MLKEEGGGGKKRKSKKEEKKKEKGERKKSEKKEERKSEKEKNLGGKPLKTIPLCCSLQAAVTYASTTASIALDNIELPRKHPTPIVFVAKYNRLYPTWGTSIQHS